MHLDRVEQVDLFLEFDSVTKTWRPVQEERGHARRRPGDIPG